MKPDVPANLIEFSPGQRDSRAIDPGLMVSGDTTTTAPPIERRRSSRWSARLIVFVHGYAYNSRPFHEKTSSLNVSAVGARLSMLATVRPGQSLLLINNVTQLEQECCVAYVARGELRRIEVAVEFLKPKPNFWHILAATLCTAPAPTGGRDPRST